MQTRTIKELGHLGDGVTDDGLFAPLTVPGDEVTGQVEGTRLKSIKITRPSDLRIKPCCAHFKSCGGCNLQHVDAPFVADWKADIVRQALAAHGLETEIRPTLTSPERSRRRATFSARRTKSGALVGFHARAAETVVAIPNCQLLDDEMRKALPLCEALAMAGASRKHALSVTVTRTENGLDVAVTGGKPLDADLRMQLASLSEDHGAVRISWGDETAALRAPSTVRFDGIAVDLPPGAFLQATEHGEAALRHAVADITDGVARIADLFAGCGTFALPLARKSEVIAFEGARDMTNALNKGWRYAQGLKPVRAETRDLVRNPVQADELAKLDAAVIDPPRAGAEAQMAEIAQSRLPRVAHVSCNPRTFARDSKTLTQSGFNLLWVQPVDQFRWSPHVEIVGAFQR